MNVLVSKFCCSQFKHFQNGTPAAPSPVTITCYAKHLAWGSSLVSLPPPLPLKIHSLHTDPEMLLKSTSVRAPLLLKTLP